MELRTRAEKASVAQRFSHDLALRMFQSRDVLNGDNALGKSRALVGMPRGTPSLLKKLSEIYLDTN